MKTIARHGAALSLALLAGHAAAQPLQDPTRPPASLMAGQGTARAIAAAPVQRAPQLQSVLIARQPGGRHVAVIDGETVRVGDLVRGARVARIDANEVELRRGRARQVLTLHAPAAGAARSAGVERVRHE
ncbi:MULTISPECIES: hypothetical protein [unclassified Massilia]|uniref:hypothetical protein n=1 Tax=unclassified Massilia TaxID=2609279 RepID=UPI001E45127D|nr:MULTISPECIES: hypothetical protein [unclassified Massilia]